MEKEEKKKHSSHKKNAEGKKDTSREKKSLFGKRINLQQNAKTTSIAWRKSDTMIIGDD